MMNIKSRWVRIAVVFAVAGAATFAGLRLAHSGSALAKSPSQSVTGCPAVQNPPSFAALSPLFVTQSNPMGMIEINSFQWGVGRGITSPTATSADRESSAPSVSEIVVTKTTDASSPTLFRESVATKPTGTPWTICAFSPNSTGGTTNYLQLNLDNVLISSFQQSGGGDRPTESITLNFTKITMNYNGQGTQSLQRNSQQGKPPFDFQTVHLAP
jgi:type VI secretion system secreted protein Hcp